MPLAAVRPSVASSSPLASALILTATIALGACATGQPLEVKKVDAVVQAPANVALYLKIAREDGQPVRLQAKDFKIYEDGKQLPPKKVKRALLPVNYAVDRYVLVVVDLSGPLVDSEYLSTLQDAISSLAERIGKDAHVGLSGFDGEGIVPFVGLDDPDTQAGLVAMRKFRPRSRNSDLWGAFIESLDALDEASNKSEVPHQQSTLILATDRVDKAGKHTREAALARVQKSSADVYVIGIGEGINREELEPLGKTAALFSPEPRNLEKPFDQLSNRIEAQLGHDYLFSYCSQTKAGKRAANHTVEVRIATPQWRGNIEHQFSTRGFTKAACDPSAVPDFKTKPANQSENEVDFNQGFTSDDESDDEATSKTKKTRRKKKPAPEEEEDQGG